MALRTLMLRKQISDLTAKLNNLRSMDEEFEKREADIEVSINEVTTDEERSAVDEAIGAFEAEKSAHEAEKNALEDEVSKLEAELREIEDAPTVENPVEVVEERKNIEVKKMDTRTRFSEMNMEQRSALVERDDVKEFLERARAIGMEKRGVTGGDLLIPDVVLDLIRHETAKASKLIGFTRLVNVPGTARQNIEGSIPEGVWTEMCANLNDLPIVFNQIEVDGYKVGGYVAICNATLADSDIALADEIITAIGGAIGKALDKAILFGTGTKMPMGVVTRLAQTSQPSDWGANAPDWTDLHSTNVKKVSIDSTRGEEFFEKLIAELAIAKPYYNADGLAWIMNRKTHLKIMAKALAFDAGGALVANTNLMPILGGTVVEFEDDQISNDEIIGGFFGNYLLAQREGIVFGESDHVRFLQDMKVFKGIARYDGIPVAGEAFVIVNFNNTDPTTSKDFAVDYANTEMNILNVTAAAGTASGDTVLTVSNAKADSPVYKYATKKTLAQLGLQVGDKLPSGWTSLTSGTTQITATAGTHIVVAELDTANRVVSVGEVISVPKT